MRVDYVITKCWLYWTNCSGFPYAALSIPRQSRCCDDIIPALSQQSRGSDNTNVALALDFQGGDETVLVLTQHSKGGDELGCPWLGNLGASMALTWLSLRTLEVAITLYLLYFNTLGVAI